MMRSFPTFHRPWLALAAIVLLIAAALMVSSLFAANEPHQPAPQGLAEQLPSDVTDPGLYAQPQRSAPEVSTEPPVAEIVSDPMSAMSGLSEAGHGPEAGQVVPEESGPLGRWLADRPAEMGPFSIQDALAADALDVEWKLHQAVANDVMTQAEADAFRAWYDRRPGPQEAPDLR